MYPTLKELYLELRRTFPMLPASQMLKSARSSIALRERLLAKVRSNKACSVFLLRCPQNRVVLLKPQTTNASRWVSKQRS